MKTIIFLSLIIFSVGANAITLTTGVVKKVKIFSVPPETYSVLNMGLALIYIDELDGACGTAEKRVAIDTRHPLYQSFLSMAMVSKTAGIPVSVGRLGTCHLRSNAWDFSTLELLDS